MDLELECLIAKLMELRLTVSLLKIRFIISFAMFNGDFELIVMSFLNSTPNLTSFHHFV